ncbi:response regulator transcription factor [Ornithinimicrobium tianjinense]|uniref:DNA-binding response regulator n=1 Tax=Ornithinimicrobium tianjinense TaxID=1195761 RepID=A0A917F8R5_9MICO|nr:response regulator transcription factor [Ornithinimicrobium tianjinense]GGF60504.1 DNA-binding response regulator [Ornithinimicrobium tianjinense]
MQVPVSPVRVAISNDYEVVVRGVHAMLAPFPERIEVVELDLNCPPKEPVHVTLYDTFSQARVDSPELASLVGQEHVGAVAVYSWDLDPRQVEVALARGCRAYLDKAMSAQALAHALERVAAGEIVVSRRGSADDQRSADAGGSPASAGSAASAGPGPDWPGRDAGLSAREAEVLTLIVQGLTNEAIAAQTFLSINSVKTYIRSAYRKIGVTRRAQAVLWGIHHGLLPARKRITDPASPASGSVS